VKKEARMSQFICRERIAGQWLQHTHWSRDDTSFTWSVEGRRYASEQMKHLDSEQ
jgi:hypothetical protein